MRPGYAGGRKRPALINALYAARANDAMSAALFCAEDRRVNRKSKGNVCFQPIRNRKKPTELPSAFSIQRRKKGSFFSVSSAKRVQWYTSADACGRTRAAAAL